jgi:hypothetical protein
LKLLPLSEFLGIAARSWVGGYSLKLALEFYFDFVKGDANAPLKKFAEHSLKDLLPQERGLRLTYA